MKLFNELNWAVTLMFILLFANIHFGDNYYVAATGSDSNPGTEGSPWLTIQYAVNQATAGDSIFVKSGVYNESITFSNSGSEEGGYIVLIGYSDTKPVIDGTGLAGSLDWPEGLIRIINKSYIEVSGFEIGNLIINNSNDFPAGVWVRGTSHHIILKDNWIHHIEQNANNAGAHGLAVYGTSGSASINNLLIEGNEISDCILGWSESLVLNGNVENFNVRNNIVHDNDNIAYDFIGHEGECPAPELDQSRQGTVNDNIAYNIDSRTNPAYNGGASADGFYVDGGKDIILERNEAYNCNIGFELASEHGGKSTSGITLRNNYIHDNTVAGIAIGGYDALRGETINCKLVNNTLYKNNSDHFDWGAEILMQYYCSDNVFKNNIIYSRSGVPLIDNSTGTGSDNHFDYNIYYCETDPLWYWDSNTYSNFLDYQSGTGEDANSYYTDPLLENPVNGNPSIKKHSPAIDKGDNLSEDIVGDKDFFGNTRIINGIIDIGAVEKDTNTSSLEIESNLPQDIKLYPNYPNPFNPETIIRYDVGTLHATSLRVNLSIYNLLGQKVATLVAERQKPGAYRVEWNAGALSSGLYIIVLDIGRRTYSQKALLLE